VREHGVALWLVARRPVEVNDRDHALAVGPQDAHDGVQAAKATDISDGRVAMQA
jgi:hypothetical protein